MLPCRGASLFIAACFLASLCLITHLIGFSCELSWILEATESLPIASYILCACLLLIFLTCTALIYGLATVLHCIVLSRNVSYITEYKHLALWICVCVLWLYFNGTATGLMVWAASVCVFLIPELGLVIYMVTKHWGLQSSNGLTEMISYLIRLLLNTTALLCVIPLILRWREEKKVLIQLESLASRLQIPNEIISARSSMRSNNHRKSDLQSVTGFHNNGFATDVVDGSKNNLYSSQSEFNAALFVPRPLFDDVPNNSYTAKRTQSLMDLRQIQTPNYRNQQSTYNGSILAAMAYRSTSYSKLNNDYPQSLSEDREINFQQSPKAMPMNRRSLSLDNLNQIPLNNEANMYTVFGKNLLGYEPKYNNLYRASNFNFYYPNVGSGHNNLMPPYNGGSYYYTENNQVCYMPTALAGSKRNSRLSLGAESDDLTKYRDVAL